jgi:indole-3-glycerol phosphate synthase
MNLKNLLDATARESSARKARYSLQELKAKIKDLPATRGFVKSLALKPFSLIAEIKAKSPSMGQMSPSDTHDAKKAHLIYEAHPVVAAISVLTQNNDFGGVPDDLIKIHAETTKPIIRKDFIMDEYEVYYSRSIGADAMLLMASVVTHKAEFKHLHDLAQSLGLDVLCEVHTVEEIERLPDTVTLCGINSRNFNSNASSGNPKIAGAGVKDLTTDLGTFDLFEHLPKSSVKIAESGLNAKNLEGVLMQYSFNAALVGTSLLRGGAQHTKAELDSFEHAIKANTKA